MDAAAKLTLIFSGTGAIAGVISGFLPNAWLALPVALILVYVTYKLAASWLRRSGTQLSGQLQAHHPASPQPQPQPQATPQTPGQAPPPAPAPAPVVSTQMAAPPKKTLLKGFALIYAKLVTKGEGQEKDKEIRFYLSAYYIMWLIFWIMTYTLLLVG